MASSSLPPPTETGDTPTIQLPKKHVVDLASIDPELVAISRPDPGRRPSVQSIASSSSQNNRSEDEANPNAAPVYPVPKRIIGGVEVPMVVMNLDRAEKAFGNISTFKNILELNRLSIPFYLNPESPYRRPVMSHHALTHNVVLKVTVPKRTGRKRKRGSDGPFEGEVAEAGPAVTKDNVCSKSRLDNPRVLRRKLQDNVDVYRVEPVGVVKGTHRFRSLADFQWNMDKSPFIQNFQSTVLSGDISKLREFKFRPGTDMGPDIDIIPPPSWSSFTIPFNYNYSQNPYVRPQTDHTGTERLINTQMPNLVGFFLSADEPTVPQAPQSLYDGPDPEMKRCIEIAHKLMEERPIFTRRSLLNALGSHVKNSHIVKRAAGYVGYQFRGGPFRDAIIKYGLDPRKDPKYRKYQTLIFNMRRLRPGFAGETWHGLRSVRTEQRQPMGDNFESHVFDGKAFWTDSKIWQICDITDSVIANIVNSSPVRPTCEIMSSGWFHATTWAKIKAVMKAKMVAIQFGRRLKDEEFDEVSRVRDITPPPGSMATRLPVPDLKLTDEEMRTIYGRNWRAPKKRKTRTFDFRVAGRKGLEPDAEQPGEAEGNASGEEDHTMARFALQEELLEEGDDSPEDESGSEVGNGLGDELVEELLDEEDLELEDEDEDEADRPRTLLEAARLGDEPSKAGQPGSETGALDEYDEEYDEEDYDGEEMEDEEGDEQEDVEMAEGFDAGEDVDNVIR